MTETSTLLNHYMRETNTTIEDLADEVRALDFPTREQFEACLEGKPPSDETWSVEVIGVAEKVIGLSREERDRLMAAFVRDTKLEVERKRRELEVRFYGVLAEGFGTWVLGDKKGY